MNLLLGLGISSVHSDNAYFTPYAVISSFLSLIAVLGLTRSQILHLAITVCFLVVLAIFRCLGALCPPYPWFFRAYLLFPTASDRSLPFLYTETSWSVCFLHFGQYALRARGTFILFPPLQQHRA
jgi:hypothetical protein